jgi:signal transduction histidine kinase/CheY-like chemotaxis protein
MIYIFSHLVSYNHRGEGDLHERRFNSSMRTTTLTGRTKYDDTSAVYTLTIYPTASLYDSFKTENPNIAATGSVIIILFTSVLFMLYDFVVRKEFNTKDKLLESKRRFVRFVSHEIRTPLNSVSMGLSLLQDECANALGYKSSEDLFAKEVHSGEQNLNAEANSDNVAFRKGTDVWKSRVFEWLYLVHDIQNNVQSSVDVLNDLLNYDKVESGTLSLELTSISIWDLIEQISNEFLLPLAKKKIAFELCFTDISVQDCKQSEIAIGSKVAMLPSELRKQRVIGDVVRLAQVLRNLISNAVKFTNEGGEIRVKVSWISPKTSNREEKKDFVLNSGSQISGSTCGWLQVKVKDSGAGMTNDQLSKLFRHGVQFNVNELQAGQGSGLGLYIAKGIIEQHNGHLYADSQGLGTGSTFTLELPLFVIDVDQDYQRQEEGEAQNDSGNGKLSSTVDHVNKLRILVVDDSETNRKLLCRILTIKGHDVDSAEDGSVAVDKVKESLSNGRNYDTILLDYEMPILNGPETAMAIRSMGCDVFIVGVTGNMLAEDVSYFRSCGANALLGKPFKMKSLEDLWNEHHVCSDTPIEERV